MMPAMPNVVVMAEGTEFCAAVVNALTTVLSGEVGAADALGAICTTQAVLPEGNGNNKHRRELSSRMERFPVSSM